MHTHTHLQQKSPHPSCIRTGAQTPPRGTWTLTSNTQTPVAHWHHLINTEGQQQKAVGMVGKQVIFFYTHPPQHPYQLQPGFCHWPGTASWDQKKGRAWEVEESMGRGQGRRQRGGKTARNNEKGRRGSPGELARAVSP